jgi:hypothetical protein
MIVKNIYTNNSVAIEGAQAKKLFSEKIYNKFFIRSSVRKGKNLKVIDSGSNFFHISSSQVLGSSFYGKYTVYTSQLNKHLKFKHFSAQESLKKTNLLNTFLMFPLAKISMILIKPIKGGFRAYCAGMLGFLPRSHGAKIVRFSRSTLSAASSFYIRRHALKCERITLAPVYRKYFALRNPKRKFLILRYVFLSVFQVNKRHPLSISNASK